MPDDRTPEESAAYWEAEAKKAFAQRDRAKADADAAKAQAALTEGDRAELDRLKQLEAAAEEQRKLEAGEYEAAKKTLLEERDAARASEQAAKDRYAQKVVETAFRGATDLFGPSGLTTLTPDFAYAGMARQVRYVPGQDGQPERIEVLGLDGEIIRGEDGKPATFGAGMQKLIEQWPGKDQILRAGQRAGSGSTGGSGSATLPVDRTELAERINAGDPEALAHWRANRPRSRTVEGAHWEKLAAQANKSAAG